jgi:hypothetical protein
MNADLKKVFTQVVHFLQVTLRSYRLRRKRYTDLTKDLVKTVIGFCSESAFIRANPRPVFLFVW